MIPLALTYARMEPLALPVFSEYQHFDIREVWPLVGEIAEVDGGLSPPLFCDGLPPAEKSLFQCDDKIAFFVHFDADAGRVEVDLIQRIKIAILGRKLSDLRRKPGVRKLVGPERLLEWAAEERGLTCKILSNAQYAYFFVILTPAAILPLAV